MTTPGWTPFPAGSQRLLCPIGKTGPQTGAAAYVASVVAAHRYRIKYEVCPEGAFDFRAGGKLPGLGGGTAPAGGSSDARGWSGRLMWNKGGQLSFYFYRVQGGIHSIETGGYGTHWMWSLDAKLIPGKWNRIEMLVDLHTGETRGYLGGVEKAHQTLKYLWGTTDKLVFSAFFGGQGKQYEPSKDEHISFRNVEYRPGG